MHFPLYLSSFTLILSLLLLTTTFASTKKYNDEKVKTSPYYKNTKSRSSLNDKNDGYGSFKTYDFPTDKETNVSDNEEFRMTPPSKDSRKDHINNSQSKEKPRSKSETIPLLPNNKSSKTNHKHNDQCNNISKQQYSKNNDKESASSCCCWGSKIKESRNNENSNGHK